MTALYHIVRGDVAGTVLMPLNALKEIHPDLHTEHSAKYAERPHVQALYIPQLDCHWGDVIHLSAVHPSVVAEKIVEAGGEHRVFSFYELDATMLDPQKTIVYPNTPRENKRATTEKDFTPFVPSDLEKWAVFPKETSEYYQKQIADGKKPLLFLFVPHILYRGTIDVSSLKLQTTE